MTDLNRSIRDYQRSLIDHKDTRSRLPSAWVDEQGKLKSGEDLGKANGLKGAVNNHSNNNHNNEEEMEAMREKFAEMSKELNFMKEEKKKLNSTFKEVQ